MEMKANGMLIKWRDLKNCVGENTLYIPSWQVPYCLRDNRKNNKEMWLKRGKIVRHILDMSVE